MLLSRIARVSALTAILLPASVRAESGSSTISGVVRDATGGALPGATITITNEETNVSVDTVTNEQGVYPTLDFLDVERMVGRAPCRPATCWTRTTSSCSRRRPATPVSSWGSPEIAEPWA